MRRQEEANRSGFGDTLSTDTISGRNRRALCP